MFSSLLESASLVFQFQTIFYVIVGVVLGQILGIIPGMTATMAMALLIPVTFVLPIWVGVPMLVAMLTGALTAGSYTAIFIGIPGTPAAMATIMDGYPLTKQGKGKKAAKLALFSSAFGDIFGTICLIFGASLLALIALKFGPPELLLIALTAMLIVGTVAGKTPRLGYLSAGIGLFLSCIGIDPVLGVSRMSFGITQLFSGIELIPMLLGLLTIPEIIDRMVNVRNDAEKISITFSDNPEDNKIHWWEIKKVFKTIIRSSFIGTFIGATPGLGANIAAFLAYNQASVNSKDFRNFGKGEIEGVAATESANSSEAAGNMIPLLALGIPGDTAVAVIAGAFLIHGITVGPTVFIQAKVEIYAIFLALLVCGIFNFIIGHAMISFSTRILQVKQRLLFPSVFILSIIGTYGFRASLFDVGVMMFFGCIGYFMKKLDITIIPLIIAFLIGPLVEKNLQRTALLINAKGSFFMFERPLFIILLLLLIFISFLVFKLQRKLAISEV